MNNSLPTHPCQDLRDQTDTEQVVQRGRKICGHLGPEPTQQLQHDRFTVYILSRALRRYRNLANAPADMVGLLSEGANRYVIHRFEFELGEAN